ncbi:sulfatase-like hydrolase/transferase [Halomarina oriensis]|uniref:Sulfatase-like hydrolase/transferase n=1 Tax=Halomarina oriensis TaxID=671145 RepID=A0A6B0GSD0_9EURY|nr:sulfatase-like hydrolase/transferase [Halomarina oriensis]MWG35005.1 sulfatase-like hydrolase/transferase [Halomarina oriensis]
MTASERPNVLVVLTDQQRHDTVGAYDSPMDLTPTLDAMADRGTRVEHAVASQPLCGPSRACLQTGQYATTNGCWKNGVPLPHDADHLLARQFDGAGYETAYVGKWHLAGTQDDPVPPGERGGYDHWVAADVPEFTSHPYEGHLFDADGERVTFEDRYRVDAYTDHAVETLETVSTSDDPFFCFLSYLEPHHQNDMETFVAPEGYAERDDAPWVPPDLRERPGDWYAELPDYYGICRRIDENLDRLLKTLDRLDEREDTVVLFTSDHGCHFRTRPGEYKRSAHEASIRVPFVMSGPGFDNGGVVEDPVELVDVAPTLLDAAAIDVPDAMQGRSLLSLLRTTDDPGGDGADDWRDEAFVQISESEIGRAIRTDRWTYAIAAPAIDGWQGGMDEPSSDTYVERYLYDLRADPAERINLVGRPEYREVADELLERLANRMVAAGEDRPEILPFENPGYREY